MANDKSSCKSIEEFKQVNIESLNFVIARNKTCITHGSCQLNCYPLRVINITRQLALTQFGSVRLNFMYFIVDYLLVNECALRGNNSSILVVITAYYLTLFFGGSASKILMLMRCCYLAGRRLFLLCLFWLTR